MWLDFSYVIWVFLIVFDGLFTLTENKIHKLTPMDDIKHIKSKIKIYNKTKCNNEENLKKF